MDKTLYVRKTQTMTTIEIIRNSNNLDVRWPSQLLLDAVGFPARVRGRVEDYLKERGMEELSLRELMGLFLPSASEPIAEFSAFWLHVPILRQPQFGPYLYDSALLTLTEADMGPAFSSEWASRIFKLKLYELREAPANKRLQQNAKKRRDR